VRLFPLPSENKNIGDTGGVKYGDKVVLYRPMLSLVPSRKSLSSPESLTFRLRVHSTKAQM